MADTVSNKKTSLDSEEAVVRAIQFFSTESWRVTSQSGRAVTLAGKPKIPWVHLACVVIGFIACLVPGIILYIMLIKKVNRFQNMVVTANPIKGGTEVSITYPDHAKKLAEKFLGALPPFEEAYAKPRA